MSPNDELPAPPIVSPDGRFYWDGTSWVPMPGSQPTAAQASPDRAIVSQSGDGQFRTIMEAVESDAQPSTIVVRPGLYRETLEIKRSVAIIGEGSVETIVIEAVDMGCVDLDTEGVRVSIGGLTLKSTGTDDIDAAVVVTEGALILEDCRITSAGGPCVAIGGSSAAGTIRRCSIHDGAAEGILIGEGSVVEVENCEVCRNVSDGIEVSEEASAQVRGCRIHHNDKRAGIFANGPCTVTIDACEIWENEVGIVSVQGSEPSARDCIIHDCKEFGVLLLSGGRGLFERCDIFNVRHLAGISAEESGTAPVFRNCWIHNCAAGGIRVAEDSQGLFEACRVFDNGVGGVIVAPTANPTFRACQIHGKGSGSGKPAVVVEEKGFGTFEDCQIFGAFVTWRKSKHIVQNCQLSAQPSITQLAEVQSSAPSSSRPTAASADPVPQGLREFESTLITRYIGIPVRHFNCVVTIAQDRLAFVDRKGGRYQMLFRDVTEVSAKPSMLSSTVSIRGIAKTWDIGVDKKAETREVARIISEAMSVSY